MDENSWFLLVSLPTCIFLYRFVVVVLARVGVKCYYMEALIFISLRLRVKELLKCLAFDEPLKPESRGQR